jgi:hypothetical protein
MSERCLLDPVAAGGDTRGTAEGWWLEPVGPSDYAVLCGLALERLIERFGATDLVEDAASSAVRTTLRRQRDGELTISREQTSELLEFIVVHAIERYHALRRQRAFKLAFDPPDPASAEVQDQASKEARMRVLREALDDLLNRMAPYLENKRHRAVFRLLFENEYRERRWTQAEIAARSGTSERTVRRVRQTFVEVWLPLVEATRGQIPARLRSGL